jgi:Transposase DDE domain group 1
VVFRADAAFAKPELYEALEEREVKYAIRLPANDNLEREIAELLTRPVGRPSYKPVVWFKSFLYKAASWKTARRVVAKVEFHFGELFPRVGFIVTNLTASSRAVVRFYNKRGTAEQWTEEGKQAVKMTRLSCHRFRSNEVRLWLSLMDARHTFVTRLAENSVVSEETIRQLAGHVSPRMLRQYAHIRVSARRAAIATLEPQRVTGDTLGSEADGAQNWAQSQKSENRFLN